MNFILKHFNLKLFHYEIISLISGFLITFVFGSLYTLGTITPYIASYINYKDDPTIHAVDVSILYPTYMVSQIFGIILSMNYLQKFIGFKALCFIGVYGMSCCAFIASFFKSYFAFVVVYGGLYGFLVGFCYLIPMLNCYAYLPTKKGLCSGICMMAFGLGSLLFNSILLKLINPNNQKQNSDHLFPLDVAENIPKALQYISLVYFGIGTVGCLLMIPKSTLRLRYQQENSGQQNYKSVITQKDSKVQDQPPIEISEEQKQKTGLMTSLTPFSKLIRSKQYLQLFLMILTSIPFGAFIAFNYKEYGETLTTDDSLITLTGSLGAISNSLSRIFWCWLLDKYSFNRIQLILNTSQIVYVILIIFVKNQYLYMIVVIMIYFSYGANYGLYPAQTVRIYGDKDGSRIYPWTFSAFSIASVLQFLFHFFIVKNMGDKGFLLCFVIFGVLLLVAEVLFWRIQFKYKDGQSSIKQITANNKDKTQHIEERNQNQINSN